MGTGDRFENKADEVKGQAKQGLGDVTDNDRLKNEGRADEAKAGIKDKVEDVKDAAKDIFGGNKNT
ncbi:CsbD family protein [Citricoccus zhacaiensis]|nr:CsbD family protein [Citricoccus zhacaiensis]